MTIDVFDYHLFSPLKTKNSLVSHFIQKTLFGPFFRSILMVIMLTQLAQCGYTTHMNPGRSPLQKYYLARHFYEKVKCFRGFLCHLGTRVSDKQQESFGNFRETKGPSGLRYFPAEVKSVENAEKQVFLNDVELPVNHDCCAI